MNLLDLFSVLGYDAQDYLRNTLISVMNNELAVLASGSSTEEDQKAYTRLKSCLQAEITFDGAQIKASFGINRDNLPASFIEKYSSLIDLAETNMVQKNQFFIESTINDMLEWPDVQQRIAEEYLEPLVAEQLSSMFGGGESA